MREFAGDARVQTNPGFGHNGAFTNLVSIEQQLAAFEAGGHRIRGALRDIFTSDDFVRF
jgi:hypothetical protein